MAAIPKSLSYFLTRMTGYSRNSTLMRAEGQDQARTVVVNLPQGIVDLRTLAMHFKVTTTDATGLLAPKHIETIIQSIVVECGGILVDAGVRQRPPNLQVPRRLHNRPGQKQRTPLPERGRRTDR